MKKKIFLVVLFSILFSGCVTTKPADTTAPQIVYVKEPLKDPLPHPEMPTLNIPDNDITVEQAMEYTIMLNGAIQKLQLLVEIYEREDRKLPEGYGNQKYAGMTLDQLKAEYLKLLGISNSADTTTTPATATK